MADRTYRQMVRAFAADFGERRRSGSFTFLSGRTLADLVLLLKYALGKLPLDDFWQDFPGEGETASPVDLLDIALGHAVDELSRPIDAIRHQAKTVTVGTSRKELFRRGVIFDLLKELGFSVKGLVAKNVPDMVRIQKAVAAVTGFTLYDIEPLDGEGRPDERSRIRIRKCGGVALEMTSRARGGAALMGTKRTILNTGKIYAGFGKSDGAPLVMIPLWGETPGVRHLLLVHVRFAEALSTREKREVLGVRYQDLKNLVNEYNLPWEDRYLEDIPIGVLLDEAVEVIAGHIRARVGPDGGARAAMNDSREESA
jgi:glucosamine--fructose-6-phosphate aminotransferase (isomerizing)